MALTLADVVRQFKSDVAVALSRDWILQACQRLGFRFRHRLLDPVTTIHLFLLQILHGNTACTALTHLSGLTFSAAAYCKARAKLPLQLFHELFQCVVDALSDLRQTTNLWRGHRTWSLDGSSFSMPDTPVLQKQFGQPGAQKKGCGFPVAHLLVLFGAGTGLIQKVLPAPLRTHDMKHAYLMHPEMAAGDVLLADRGFASFAHLALLLLGLVHAVFRCHQKQIVNFRPHRKHRTSAKDPAKRPTSRWLKRLGRCDQLVEYRKPKVRPKWMSAAEYARLPEAIVVRELRYQIAQKGCRTHSVTLVTTLLDPVLYPALDLADLYDQRWQVETNLRHLKTTMKMEVLHCKTVDGILKELMMFALAYNLVRLVMLEASNRQNQPLARISFVDALRWLCNAEPGTPLPALVVNPERKRRVQPRVIKRRGKEYPHMTKPRMALQEALENTKVRD